MKILRIQIKLLLISIVVALLVPGIAQAQPALIFEGVVTFYGNNAPVGTVIVAEVGGVEVATNAPEGGIEKSGKYMLVIQNEGYAGETVVFKVDGIVAGEHVYVISMDPIVTLDLHVQAIAPAGDTDDTADIGNSITERAVAYFSGLFGLGTKAVVGIAVGLGALIIAIVSVLIIVNRRRRYFI